MEIKLCENGDGRIAVGTGIRPIRYCRPCYIERFSGEFQQWNVVTPYPDTAVVCAKTGEDIERGGTVWLDPVETSIPALVYGGFIAPIEDPAPAKAKGQRVTEA
ncbi:hypothetical protein GCM10010168_85860 [Actinoplanes ianthinogenes]|uniref:Uncharacterized protein n=1 Tax=Actinoplanes ianthinogenes TaxID=122358 RepID=A0ABM7M146_9ACTN|nr:hypothetical protein [Actinoplanes ianthinogenes]BCJ45317.1 hypothetical protein Aiant_59740 [Actinoplanes ianthinogenes]GGR53744.1 hypothetical protein GCM10010168_85860 [Actinoplanes ianthinogenes]